MEVTQDCHLQSICDRVVKEGEKSTYYVLLFCQDCVHSVLTTTLQIAYCY